MKKKLTILSGLASVFLSAQNNQDLKREFATQRVELNKKYDAYVIKHYGNEKMTANQKEIEENRSNLAGFLPSGIPYFYTLNDIDQIKSSNSDFLQNGNINGLAGSFNGEGVKITIFDGGVHPNSARIFAEHSFFDNIPSRILNREAATTNYGGHATSVAGFIGAKEYIQQVNFNNGSSRVINFQGIAKNSTIESYGFRTTTLPGAGSPSDVFEKILIAQPNISNHSYGANLGWTNFNNQQGEPAWLWQGRFESPNIFGDLQGAYFTHDEKYDRIVYNNPSYIIVKASGNFFGMGPAGSNMQKFYVNDLGNLVQFGQNDVLPPNNCSLGYDCINNGSLAKNIIVVGAADRITTNDGRYTAAGDVIHSDYSSAGPRDDGGVKPDISAVGTDVASASTFEGLVGSQGITVGAGTSYSAPVVTGIIGLWTQIYRQLFNNQEFDAASAKNLVIHSALEAGNVGPDRLFGWGFINAKRGAELLVGKSNNTIIFDNEILNNSIINTKIVKASGYEPLKVTIAWTDPEYALPDQIGWADVDNNRSSRLVNDLDLRIIDTETNTVYMPWKLNVNNPIAPADKGDNTVDNVEQVIINAPTAGRNYRIEVANKGNLVNNSGGTAPQVYSIIASGFSENVLASEETSKLAGLLIAPTQTKNVVKILKAPRKSTFNLYDLSGKKLKSGTTIDELETVIDLSVYPKGIYIIEVNTVNGLTTKRIMKE